MAACAAFLVSALLLPLPQGVGGVVPRNEVFVSPAGSDVGDEADGSRERPFAGLERAVAELERRSGPRPTLVLLEGCWTRTQSLVLDSRHDGLTVRAAGGCRPVLLGGLRLVNPTLAPVRDSATLQRLPTDAARAAVRELELPAGTPLFPPVHRGMGNAVVPVGTELIVDGVAYTRARWPNEGFAKVGEVLDRGSVPRNRADDVPAAQREKGPPRGGVFRLDSERLARWQTAPAPWAFGYWFHDWADGQLPVAAIDAAAGTLTLGRPHRYGLKTGTPFYVTNLLEELDAPGECHVDVAAGRVFLWPANEHVEEVVVTTLAEPLIRLRGAREVTIEGLGLRGTRGAGVVVEDCEGCELRGLRIDHTGTHGIDVRGGRGDTVAACVLSAIGAAGIKASGGDRATLTPAGHRVLDCDITHFGRLYRTYQPGIALGGVGQIATGNRLAHAPHSALLFGGNEHRIEGNEIYDVLRETGDCGAIYCGRDWAMHGTVIRRNFIHHLRGQDGRWQNAIYLDDMASGIEVSQNLVWRCHWGMLVGGGRDLRIEGNVFAECGLGIRFDARGVGWMQKHIADPSTSTLHQGLAALPVDRPPWSVRYPTVQRTLSDRFGRPAGSRVLGNVFLATPEGSVADREAVEVEGAVVREEAPSWLVEDAADPFAVRFTQTEAFGIPLNAFAPRELILAEGGRSEWCIVVADAPDEVERAAAGRLADFLGRMSGARLPVVAAAAAPARHRILIGAAAPPAYEPLMIGEDGFAILAYDQELLLQGGGGLGVDYAVTALLEHFGCRMWAPGALHVPRHDSLRLPADFVRVESPRVWFRHVNYGPARDPEYRRWHKLDSIQEEVGRLWAPWWVHSALRHLPPERWFDEHPEYYALVGGERRPTQLCLTNPDVFRLVKASVARLLEQHPGVKYVSVSQADNYEACQCAAAQALNEREGTQMAETLQFTNALAEAFPDRIISTLAYQYTRKPPQTLRPRSNVSIMLCTIEEDRARPIADNPTSGFPADFEGWSAICDDIFLWDYEVQFASPVAPFPNLRVLQPNVKWFVANGVRHLFLQGNGLHTELAELRCYLLAKLAWNAEVDVEATIDEFLAGYYGSAAPHLRAYLDLLHDELGQSGEPLLIYGNPALAKDSWLRPEVMARAALHLERAEHAVAVDPVLRERVEIAWLPLMYAELEIAKRRGVRPGGIYERLEGAWRVRPRIRELLARFLAGVEAAGIPRLREQDLTPAEYRAAWQALLDPTRLALPSFGAAVTATPAPSAKYADGDAGRLTDGMPGGDRYPENWVGWEGTDAEIVLDLGTSAARGAFAFAALQDPKSWIWLPDSVRVETSDGDGWRVHATLGHEQPDRDPLVHRFTGDFAGARFRYLRLVVDADQQCPAWHLGAGQPSWFFLDEVEVRPPAGR